jgi:dephospho-CoA kinase
MFILGLTGGIAAGKTTATDFFSNKGIQIVDADEISRNLQKNGEAGYVEILQRYGDGILGPDKEIDRKKLREKAFSKPDEKEWLESLMHPLIREATMNAFNSVKSDWAIYSAPLWSNRNQFERVLVIDAPKHIQLERIKSRDNTNIEIAEGILNAQISSNDRINYATDLIVNDGSIDELNNKLEFYFNLYTRLANDKKS